MLLVRGSTLEKRSTISSAALVASSAALVAYHVWWWLRFRRLRHSLPPGPPPEGLLSALLRHFFPKRFCGGPRIDYLSRALNPTFFGRDEPDFFWADHLHEQYGDSFTLWQTFGVPHVVTRNPDAIEEALRQDGKTWHFPPSAVDSMRHIYGSSISTLHGREHASRRSLINTWWIKGMAGDKKVAFDQMLEAVSDTMHSGILRSLAAASSNEASLPLTVMMKTCALQSMSAIVFGAGVAQESLKDSAPGEMNEAHTVLNWRAFGRIFQASWPRPITILLEAWEDLFEGWRTKAAMRSISPLFDSLESAVDGGLAAWIRGHMLGSLDVPGERMYWRGQAWDFVDGGVDTVMNFLRYAVLLLYSPALSGVLSDIRQEIHGCDRLDGDGRCRFKPSSDNFTEGKLPLLESVLKECMRLFPPIMTQLPRVMIKPGATRLGELLGIGPGAQADVVLILNIFSLHRHPAHWDRPHEFRPERWSAIDGGVKAYRPFGGGIHGCLSAKYLPFQLRMVVAEIIDRFDLELVRGGGVDTSPGYQADQCAHRATEPARQAVADVEALFYADKGMGFERSKEPLRIRVHQR